MIAALKQWAVTDRQREVIDAIVETGSQRAAARKLGVARATIDDTVATLRYRAARAGHSPEHGMTHPVPAPFAVKGVSTLYDEAGAIRAQWVKSHVDQEKLEQAMREAVAALAQDVPRAQRTKVPKPTIDELCNLYTITDYHVGMRSWEPETGADWDLEIAERTLLGAFDHMVEASPRAGTAIVNQLGDFLHFDSLAPVTPTAGNMLDADSRYSKVVRTATKLLRLVIDAALARHARVFVVMAEGNHDIASSVWLRHLFGLLYEREPRVTVIDSESPYYVHQHGKTMLAFHHGHLTKNDKLPLIFAARHPQMWGTTTKRYCHVGHMHHVDEKEHAGMKVIQHPTLAAADAYASRHGWDAQREITAITYHREYGQVARTTVCPEMLTP